MDFATDTLLYIMIGILIMTLITVGFFIMEFNKLRARFNGGKPVNNELVKLKLQALERFTLFAERASLKNLVSRTPATGLRVVETAMHGRLKSYQNRLLKIQNKPRKNKEEEADFWIWLKDFSLANHK